MHLVLCFAFKLNAQSTVFAPEGALWYFEIGQPFSGDIGFMTIEAMGDTTIDGKVCRILIKNGNPGCYSSGTNEYIYDEDSVVYFYDTNFNAFQVLYDFTSIDGTSWYIKVPNPYDSTTYDSLHVLIDSINSVVFNDMELKVLYTKYTHSASELSSYSLHQTITERLGGLLYSFIYLDRTWGFCDDQYSRGLRCYEDPEFGLYETGLAASCDTTYILSTVSEQELDKPYKIFPNPAHDNIYLQIQDAGCLQSVNQIILYHSTGQMAWQTVEAHCGLNTIPVNNLSHGIYFLHYLQNGQQVLSQKIIIE